MLGKVITFRLTVGLLDETETVFENGLFAPLLSKMTFRHTDSFNWDTNPHPPRLATLFQAGSAFVSPTSH